MTYTPRCDCLAGDLCEHPEPSPAEVAAIRAKVSENGQTPEFDVCGRRYPCTRPDLHDDAPRPAQELRTRVERLIADAEEHGTPVTLNVIRRDVVSIASLRAALEDPR